MFAKTQVIVVLGGQDNDQHYLATIQHVTTAKPGLMAQAARRTRRLLSHQRSGSRLRVVAVQSVMALLAIMAPTYMIAIRGPASTDEACRKGSSKNDKASGRYQTCRFAKHFEPIASIEQFSLFLAVLYVPSLLPSVPQHLGPTLNNHTKRLTNRLVRHKREEEDGGLLE